MLNRSQTVLSVALTLFALSNVALRVLAAPEDTPKKAELKPEVAALLKQSTEAYQKMKSYQHTAVVKLEVSVQGEKRDETKRYTLALERPNKFCYKLNEGTASGAAVSDGKTSYIYKNDQKQNQYMQKTAPVDYKGINIVDDVVFEPLGTYVVALMLQGDALADKDVRAGLEKSTMLPSVTESGKKWQVMRMPFGSRENAYDFYFNAEDHLLGKVVMTLQGPGGEITETETEQNVKINKPIEASVFDYTPPANAKKVDKFTAPQRPDDALVVPGRRSSGLLSLAAYLTQSRRREGAGK